MRFLFFNVVVGLALVYLYNGGKIDMSRFENALSSAPQLVADNTPKKPKPPSGHARDVIEEPAKPTGTPPAPKPEKPKAVSPAPVASPQSIVSAKSKATQLPTIEHPVTVTKRAVNKPVFENTDDNVSTEVADRREEVLGSSHPQSSSQKFALKEGSTLMTTAERRRSLETLAEEMEMLYLEKVGG